MLARIWQRTKSELARADALLHITKWLPDVGLKDAALIKWVEQHYEKLEFDEKIGVYLIK
jgi:hypothetical protein